MISKLINPHIVLGFVFVLSLLVLGKMYNSVKAENVKLKIDIQTYSATIEKAKELNKKLEQLDKKQKETQKNEEDLISNRRYFDAN